MGTTPHLHLGGRHPRAATPALTLWLHHPRSQGPPGTAAVGAAAMHPRLPQVSEGGAFPSWGSSCSATTWGSDSSQLQSALQLRRPLSPIQSPPCAEAPVTPLQGVWLHPKSSHRVG